MLRLYNTLLLPLRLLLPLWSAVLAREPGRRAEWDERRLRTLPSPLPGAVWIHGASVGEARIVGAVARGIRESRPRLPIVVSAQTRTGRERLPVPPDADAAFFLPLDLAGYPRRLIEALQPAILVLIETELWPNLIAEARDCGVSVLVLNGRLSPRRMGRYRRLSGLYGPCVRGLDRVGAQTGADAARFLELGLPETSIEVTGNVKYDLPLPDGDAATWRHRLGLEEGRQVWVAGSTGPGEEEQVLRAYQMAREQFGKLFLVLAPRHPPRAEEVAGLLRDNGVTYQRLSRLPAGGVAECDSLLVDTLGDLGQLYRLASIAFVGGTLVPVGGHNLLEPATVGAPVLFGPHTDHVSEMAADLERARGGIRVRDAEELGRAVARLAGDTRERRRIAAAATGVLTANRGAMARSVALALATLDRRGA